MNIFRKILAAFIDREETKSPTLCTLTSSQNQVENGKYGSLAATADCHKPKKSSSSQNRLASVQNQVHTHPSPFWATVFHIIFLSADSPLLLLPSSFIVVGILTRSMTMVFIFVFYLYTTYMLMWSADEVCKLKLISGVSYSDLVYEAFDLGPSCLRPLAATAQSLISCIIILGWYASCILLGLLIANHLQTLCRSWLDTYLAMQNIVCSIVIPVLLLNSVRRFKLLEPFTALGCLLNTTAILLVLLYATTDSIPWNLQSMYGSVEKIPQLFGVFFGNVNVTRMVGSLKNELVHPDKFEAPCGTLTAAYVGLFIMYFSMSLFFCLKYGTNVPESLIDVVPTSLITALLTSIMNVTGLYLLIPITLYVPLDILWNDVLKKQTKSLRHKFTWKYVLRVLLVILTFFVVNIKLNISFVLSFFGTVTSSLDSLVFPIIIHSLVVWRVGENSMTVALLLVKNMVILLFGLILTLAGIIDCVSGS